MRNTNPRLYVATYNLLELLDFKISSHEEEVSELQGVDWNDPTFTLGHCLSIQDYRSQHGQVGVKLILPDLGLYCSPDENIVQSELIRTYVQRYTGREPFSFTGGSLTLDKLAGPHLLITNIPLAVTRPLLTSMGYDVQQIREV